MLEQRDFELFKKYKKVRYVDVSDADDIADLESIGFMKRGMGTVTLTSLGKDILHREKVKRNPLRRFFSALLNSSM